MVRLLLEAGLEVDLQDRRGMTALMHAAAGGHEEVVELLLTEGAADATLFNVYGGSALSIAQIYDDDNSEVDSKGRVPVKSKMVRLLEQAEHQRRLKTFETIGLLMEASFNATFDAFITLLEYTSNNVIGEAEQPTKSEL